jgi:2-oxoisovalerate dehydrogenase E2 component (dihydrolipoyl transacylase)
MFRQFLQRSTTQLGRTMGSPGVGVPAVRSFVTASQPTLAVIPFNLADIGEGIAEVEIMGWMISDGDDINEFDEICEVQSDKATVTITSRYTGKVTKVHYEVGELAAVGQPLISIDVEGEVATEQTKEKTQEKTPPTPPSPPVPTPDPPTVSVPSEPVPAVSVTTKPAPSLRTGGGSSGGPVLATPAVRRLAGEHNVMLSNVDGTGKSGRVTKGDLLRHLGHVAQAKHVANANAAGASTATGGAGAAAVAAATPGEIPPARAYVVSEEGHVVRDEPIRGISRMMVSSMKESLKIPHFGYNDEIEMDALMELRKDLLPSFEKRGVKLSFMPMMMKAASLALADYPSLNSSVSADEEVQIYKGAHNIGVAMDTPRGLLVPNVMHCESRSIYDIAYELNRLQAMGAQNKLGADELTGKPGRGLMFVQFDVLITIIGR